MEKKELNIKDFNNCWINYYYKLDGSRYSCGVPQYHRIVKVKRNSHWEILHDNNVSNSNLRLADEIRDFLNKFRQIKKEVNFYGLYDMEGSMYLSSELLQIYLKDKNTMK